MGWPGTGSTIRNSYAIVDVYGGGSRNDHVSGISNGGTTVQYSYYKSDATFDGENVNNSLATGKTALQLRQLTATQTQTDFGTAGRWSTDVWDFGTNAQYPALKSTTGNLICGQPAPRRQCSP